MLGHQMAVVVLDRCGGIEATRQPLENGNVLDGHARDLAVLYRQPAQVRVDERRERCTMPGGETLGVGHGSHIDTDGQPGVQGAIPWVKLETCCRMEPSHDVRRPSPVASSCTRRGALDDPYVGR